MPWGLRGQSLCLAFDATGEERETHSREEATEALALRGCASSSVPQGPPRTPATRHSGTWFGSEETGRTVGACARACCLSRRADSASACPV